MTIDVGTGDGRAVLDAAAREPTTLVLGLDASSPAMVESSRRAAGPSRKGGRENARFIVAGAEKPPAALVGVASLVTVLFPWGSLLRGCVGLDPAVASGVARLVAPHGTLQILLAPSARDGLEGVPTEVDRIVEAAARAFEPLGLTRIDGRAATAEEVVASGSTWAKRLAVGRPGRAASGNGNGHGGGNSDSDRTVTLLRFERRGR